MSTALFQSPIIQSALDLDVYKINMMQAAYRFYPETQVRYELIVRSDDDLSDLIEEVRQEIEKLALLAFTAEQITYLKNQAPYLTSEFLEYLRHFRFVPQQQVLLETVPSQSGQSQLRVAIQGIWHETILYETLVMSIISEVRNRRRWQTIPYSQFEQVLANKISQLKNQLQQRRISNFRFSEMGTRRRFSAKVQRRWTTCARMFLNCLLAQAITI